MGRWALIGLVVIGGIVAAYYGLRSPPAFDLDNFSDMVRRLRAGHQFARRAADTDAIPAWLKEDAAHVEAVQAILAAHADDCQATADKLRAHHQALQQRLAEDPDRMTIDRIDSLPPLKRQRVAQQIIFVLAPIYAALEPEVERWAWECKEESAVLDEVLGTVKP